MIYFDNAATTIAPPEVILFMNKWLNRGNPSANYKSARDCRDLFKKFRAYIANLCGFISYEPDIEYTPSQKTKLYQIVFTSGASESNNTIVRSITTSYKFHQKVKPHVITSSIEHKSMLDCVEQLADLDLIDLTLVRPNKLGFINPDDIRAAIKSRPAGRTCLISIMQANNETGAINNIKDIGAIAHEYNIPFYTDAVQSFGKYSLDPIKMNVDAFGISCHKIYSPPGIGLLIIKRQLIEGFRLLPEICGSQNCGFRGGTENVYGIAGGYKGIEIAMTSRDAKNKQLAALKKLFIDECAARIKCQTYLEYLEMPAMLPISLVFLSTNEPTYMPNIILLSIIKRTEPPMCNVNFKNELERRGIIVSIGSACNTGSSKTSHVLGERGLNVDRYVRRGAMRISFSDDNTPDEILAFISVFFELIKNL